MVSCVTLNHVDEELGFNPQWTPTEVPIDGRFGVFLGEIMWAMKKPLLFRVYKDYTTQVHRDYNKVNHFKDTY